MNTAPESPAVSVIMAVRNGERHLPAAVRSILGQSFSDFEFIVTDDGSTDDTGRLLDDLAARDARMRVVHRENTGLTAALNRMIPLCRGRFIARQDADDLSDPDRFARQVALLERRRDVMLLGTGGFLIDEEGTVLKTEHVVTGSRRIARALRTANRFIHGSVMLRRSCLARTGAYREEFRCAQDYDLFLRIAECFPVDNLDLPLYRYRLSPAGVSSARSGEQQRAALIARKAALLRRRGLLTDWSPGVYATLAREVDEDPRSRRSLACAVSMEEGRNLLLQGDRRNARRAFREAFRRRPGLRPLYHLLRTLA